MKALPGVLLAFLAVTVGASACSDSTSTRPGAAQGGNGAGETSNAGEGPAASAGSSLGEGGGSTSEGGSTGEAGVGTPADAGAAGAGGGGALSSTEYCETFAEALCTWRSTCAQSDDCLTWGGYLRFVQECADARASEADDFVSFVPETAVECLEVVTMQATICSGSPPFFRPPVQAACQGVFAGTVEQGDECSKADFAAVFDECAAGYCERAAGECLGSCVPYQQEDGDCSDGQLCEPGLFCSDGSCEPPRGVGEECALAVCEPGLSCFGEPLTCHAIVALGGDCVEANDCVYPAGCVADKCAVELEVGDACRSNESCKAGLYCNGYGADPVCATRIAVGDACPPSSDSCVDGFACASVEPYVCVELLGDLNEPCGPYGCESDLWCDYTATGPGICRARVLLDGECLADIACVDGLYCVGSEPSKCGPPGDVGEPCSAFEPQSCQGELFCARDTVTCAAARAVNQTCNPYVPEDSCQAGLFCACLSAQCPTVTSSHQPQDVCLAQRANGQDCTNSHECTSQYCSSEKCAPLPVSTNCTR